MKTDTHDQIKNGPAKRPRASARCAIADTALLSADDYPNITRVEVGEDYRKRQNVTQLAFALFLLHTIRKFETLLLGLDEQRLIHGPLHSSIGQEAVAVGATLGLRKGDKVSATHRAHHHFLAKAIDHYVPADFDPLTAPIDDRMRGCARKTLAEILGLSTGWCEGRGGSMHLYDRASGNIGTNAIVGGGIPIASGAAFAEMFRGTGNVALCYFGDGAVSIGAFHEGINMASVWKLPAIFVIENNLYAVATNNLQTSGLTDLAIRACGYNLPGLIADGMDPLAMKRAVELARAHASAGRGPVIIEAKTYRFCHQSGALPGSAYGYRDAQEETRWRSRDPLTAWAENLRNQGILASEDMERVERLADDLVGDARDYCVTLDGNCRYSVRPELRPDGPRALVGVRSDGREFAKAGFAVLSQCEHVTPMKMQQAISAVLARRMETDPEVFILGEEVGRLRGGIYGTTKDALARFPKRVYNTPIAEAGFVGLAQGAAMAGLKPVVEIMFPDFALVAADQFFNQIGAARHMYGGQVDLPLVVRMRSSTGRGFGAQHSGDAIGFFALCPGWRILAPTTSFDYIGLFNSAMVSLDPVLIIEHHELYPAESPVPQDDLDYLLPLGQAVVRRQGGDVTVAGYLSLIPRLLRMAGELAKEGIEVEVVDLVELDHANMDFETLAQSVRKTGALVIAEQAMASQSLGPFIASQVQSRLFDYLDHPVELVASRDVPMPVSRELEQFCLVSDEEIRRVIVSAAKRNVNASE